METILCLGDSLTFGARDEYDSSYPAHLSRLFWEQDKKEVYCINFGINGETSGQLLRRAYNNVRSCPEAKIALIMIGTNDSILPQEPDIYEDHLRQIVMVVKQTQEKIGIGLLPPMNGLGLPNYPSNGNEYISGYNEKIFNIAKIYNCFLADFRGMVDYIIDTVHFDHKGYEIMAEIWYRAIKGD